MQFSFTPAAERVLTVAANWSSGKDSNALYLPEVLLGLLQEPECRAAQMLAQTGISAEIVRHKWGLTAKATPTATLPGSDAYSRPLVQALKAAEARLWDYPQPLSLATEHILLGILAAENQISDWLQDFGMHPDVLEDEVHRLAGHERGPIEIPSDDQPIADGFGVVDLAPQKVHVPAAGSFNENVSLFRILDAAANRASEGLRVIEDYVRFALDDRHLTMQLKSLRHRLTHTLATLSTQERLAARDTLADVGATTKTESEFVRTDISSVVTASFQRLQQALRSLEEFSKVQNPTQAVELEKLRYLTYTLERAVYTTRSSLERLGSARLYVLLDGGDNELSFRTLAESLVAAGVHAVQLRDKTLDDRTLLSRARILRTVTANTATLFIMNDRPDLAVLADADGVHVGQEELTVKDTRTIVGPKRLIGVSTHNIEQARQAVLDGADYIGAGPAFPSQTKQFADFPGLKLMQAVGTEIRLPAFLIGGITLANLEQALAAGAQRVAVGAAICDADDVVQAAGDFLACLSSKSS